MTKNVAVILAAGRGSRMKGFTEDKPKCLLELAGKTLLQWQMEALHKAGIHDILVMRGYKASMLSVEALPWANSFQTADNIHWESSNMLRTLLCADTYVRAAFAQGARHLIVSYSDIVYTFQHVCDLLTATQDINITYDAFWEDLWRLRFGNPLLDAETFKQESNLLCEIGEKPQHLQDIQGQFMGLIHFSPRGWDILCHICTCLSDIVDKTDMTSFLRILLHHGNHIGVVPVQGRWCEADSQEDLQAYEKMLPCGNWSHDWR